MSTSKTRGVGLEDASGDNAFSKQYRRSIRRGSLGPFKNRRVLAGFEPNLPERYRDAEYVFLGNIDPLIQMNVLDQLRRMKLVVCDTMDHWIGASLDGLKKVLQRIEILVVNDSEARLLSGYDNIVRAARAILEPLPYLQLGSADSTARRLRRKPRWREQGSTRGKDQEAGQAQA